MAVLGIVVPGDSPVAEFVPARRVAGSVPTPPPPTVVGRIDETIEAAIDATGHVTDTKRLRATQLGADLVGRAVANWRFRPATDQGMPFRLMSLWSPCSARRNCTTARRQDRRQSISPRPPTKCLFPSLPNCLAILRWPLAMRSSLSRYSLVPTAESGSCDSSPARRPSIAPRSTRWIDGRSGRLDGMAAQCRRTPISCSGFANPRTPPCLAHQSCSRA